MCLTIIDNNAKLKSKGHMWKLFLVEEDGGIRGQWSFKLEEENPRFDREHFLAVVRGEKDINSRPTRKGKNQ